MRCWRTRVGSVLSHFIGNVARFAGWWGEARAQPWNPVRGWHPLHPIGVKLRRREEKLKGDRAGGDRAGGDRKFLL